MSSAFSCHKQMMIFVLILAVVYLIGLIALAGGILRAPEGFEDERGFQQGKDSLTDAAPGDSRAVGQSGR